MEINVIERLKELSQMEVKRRKEAVKCLEELTEILATNLEEYLGVTHTDSGIETNAIWVPIYEKEQEKYLIKNSTIYFRYTTLYSDENCAEHPGFYLSYSNSLWWGYDLLEQKGNRFWNTIKAVTDWLTNYMPTWLNNIENSRVSRHKRLVSIVGSLKEMV